jgi:hypothetical protein
MPSAALLEAVAVTTELCGRTLSDGAARVFVDDLSVYPEQQVMGALKRCRKEVRGALTVADVVSRLDDGRPGVEEAWAMLPKSEADSAVWTTETSQAFGAAVGLLDAGEQVAARMAFKEIYLRLVQQSRDAAMPVEWHVTLGHDPKARDGALANAVHAGRISMDHARKFSPMLTVPKEGQLAIADEAVKSLQ